MSYLYIRVAGRADTHGVSERYTGPPSLRPRLEPPTAEDSGYTGIYAELDSMRNNSYARLSTPQLHIDLPFYTTLPDPEGYIDGPRHHRGTSAPPDTNNPYHYAYGRSPPPPPPLRQSDHNVLLSGGSDHNVLPTSPPAELERSLSGTSTPGSDIVYTQPGDYLSLLEGSVPPAARRQSSAVYSVIG